MRWTKRYLGCFQKSESLYSSAADATRSAGRGRSHKGERAHRDRTRQSPRPWKWKVMLVILSLICSLLISCSSSFSRCLQADTCMDQLFHSCYAPVELRRGDAAADAFASSYSHKQIVGLRARALSQAHTVGSPHSPCKKPAFEVPALDITIRSAAHMLAGEMRRRPTQRLSLWIRRASSSNCRCGMHCSGSSSRMRLGGSLATTAAGSGYSERFPSLPTDAWGAEGETQPLSARCMAELKAPYMPIFPGSDIRGKQIHRWRRHGAPTLGVDACK